jgi:hypothetical protein
MEKIRQLRAEGTIDDGHLLEKLTALLDAKKLKQELLDIGSQAASSDPTEENESQGYSKKERQGTD